MEKRLNNYLTRTLCVSVIVILSACSDGDNASPTVIGGNELPSINIINGNPLTLSSNESVDLQATATDPEDGDISSDIEWSSDLDGVLGYGSELTVTLSNGDHRISALVTDSANQSTEAAINAIVGSAHGVATVSWVAPIENEDDSPLTDLTGFVIHYGQSEDRLNRSMRVSDPNAYSAVVTNLTTETRYYFAVTAVNSLSLESGLSPVVSKYVEE